MNKTTKIAWMLWFSKCNPKHKQHWKIKANTWSADKAERFTAYIQYKLMGMGSKFPIVPFLYFYGHLALAYLAVFIKSVRGWAGI